MVYLPRSLARLCGGVAVGASVVTCLLSSATSAAAAAAPCANTTEGVTVVLASQSGTLSPACVTQQGNVLIIVLPQNAPGAAPQTVVLPQNTTGTALQTLTPTVTPVLNTLPTPPATEGDMSNVSDPRINSYAKRQAIRDQYRGQIDEVTFNDELGDGVPVDTALADAMAANKHPRA